MKKLTLGIIIGIALSIGTITFAQSQVRLIMVPEYISGYSTIDLLNYVATLKSNTNPTINIPIAPQISQPKIAPVPVPHPKTIPLNPTPQQMQTNARGNASA